MLAARLGLQVGTDKRRQRNAIQVEEIDFNFLELIYSDMWQLCDLQIQLGFLQLIHSYHTSDLPVIIIQWISAPPTLPQPTPQITL